MSCIRSAVYRKYLYLVGSVMLGVPTVGYAQATASPTVTEVIVTARKREESLQDVPVVVNALGKQQIEAFAVRTPADVATLVPSLVVEPAANGSGALTLRGISTSTTQNAGEQAVTLVLDGVTISHGNALKAGLIDLAQIEVLKGPQALYFGKNASGGVISMTTAGPTDTFFSQLRFAHEFNAQESTAEAILSGPITESLGYRFVGNYTTSDGWMENRATSPVRDPTGPDYRDIFGRLTLTYRPSSNFDATLKTTYLDHEGHGINFAQTTVCKPGPVRTEPADDCTPNKYFVMADPPGIPAPFDKYMFFISSLEANLKVAENITLTSQTGYWRIKEDRSQGATPQDQGPLLIGAQPVQKVDNVSQELRITTDFEGRLNGMAGVFFDSGRVDQDDKVTVHPLVPGLGRPLILLAGAPMHQIVKQRSFSVFAQATFKLLENLELSGGARYVRDRKAYEGRTTAAFATFPIAPIRIIPDKKTFSDLTPEVSLTWKPTDDLTLYGAYKEGFKSGSFVLAAADNFQATVTPRDIAYNPETVKGGEFGLKSRLFDRTVRFNVAAYYYKYVDLQFQTFDAVTLSTTIRNVAGSTIKGIEVESAWSPPAIEGLTLSAAANYNRSRFTDFEQDCTPTQLATRACPNPVTSQQNLEGQQMTRAPDWTANLGFSLDRPVGSGLRFRMNGNARYSSSYHTDEKQDPRANQKSFWLYDASIGIRAENGGWDLDLIGRNLSNEAFFLGSPTPLPGTNNYAAGQPGDVMGTIGRLRQIMIQFTVRPQALFRN